MCVCVSIEFIDVCYLQIALWTNRQTNKSFLKRLNACICQRKKENSTDCHAALLIRSHTFSLFIIRSIKILTQSFFSLLRQHIKEIRYVQILLANVTDDLSEGFNFCHTHEIWLCYRWRERERDNHRTYTRASLFKSTCTFESMHA